MDVYENQMQTIRCKYQAMIQSKSKKSDKREQELAGADLPSSQGKQETDLELSGSKSQNSDSKPVQLSEAQIKQLEKKLKDQIIAPHEVKQALRKIEKNVIIKYRSLSAASLAAFPGFSPHAGHGCAAHTRHTLPLLLLSSIFRHLAASCSIFQHHFRPSAGASCILHPASLALNFSGDNLHFAARAPHFAPGKK